jgi:imidazolonepropionase-like amidohydrolase
LALVAAGIPPEDAIASASWRAREFLGLPSLKAGTVADAVIYAQDPRKNLAILAHPAWVIRAGKLARRPILG